MGAEMGLREIKKRMTREAIADAALRLTAAQGLANVTIDDIAAEAFVSPRTVSNYFPSKEEAVLAAGGHDLKQVIEDFGDTPGHVPALTSLRDLLSAYARENPDRLQQSAQMAELERENPSLRPYRVAQQAALEDELRARIAARTGTDAATDLYPWLVASAVVNAVTSALAIWSRADYPQGQLAGLIEEAFAIAAAGYPQTGSEPEDPAGDSPAGAGRASVP